MSPIPDPPPPPAEMREMTIALQARTVTVELDALEVRALYWRADLGMDVPCPRLERPEDGEILDAAAVRGILKLQRACQSIQTLPDQMMRKGAS